MATRLATPGVYLVEQNAFTSSVVAVPTAVPAFIGYTEKAARGKTSLHNKPTRITSLAEYVDLFGGAPKTTFKVKAKGDSDFELSVDAPTQYMLFSSIRLFFANGGGACYVVSVGDYSKGVSASDLNDPKTGKGLPTLLKEQEPTMVVVPDAVLLEAADCYSLYQAMLLHCGQDTKSRVAVLDVHGGHRERTLDEKDVVNMFREGVGNNFLAYGAAYYPWVNTTIVGANEVDYHNISNLDGLVQILTREAERTFLGGPSMRTAEEKAPKTPPKAPPAGDGGEKKPQAPADPQSQKKYEAAVAEISKLTDSGADAVSVGQTLSAISNTYRDVLKAVREQLNLLPPAAAMAGVYSLVDNMTGVQKAPANVSLNAVISPAVSLTSEQQEDLNLPLSGKAVNAIRSFVGKGILVWGARTLDGNSQDWRYVSVRRAVIMLEQSIKNSVESYVFEANNAQTWLRVRTSIENFLTDMWKGGVLAGSSTVEAFDVQVGLGVTMTPVDILDGVMRITVKVAITRPAEFIVITFQQKMQES
ncbi:MAG: phage tail sheath C-terminal domain-containing protein [Bacteroidia bacterium]|nr:phage tail sheath C-terminal domain-containing protein [Bacteroidia bacterium]